MLIAKEIATVQLDREITLDKLWSYDKLPLTKYLYLVSRQNVFSPTIESLPFPSICIGEGEALKAEIRDNYSRNFNKKLFCHNFCKPVLVTNSKIMDFVE